MDRTRVFIIEDKAELLRNLTKALGAYPELEIVGSAREGEQGLDDVLTLKPELLVLDLELPGIDGIEVIRRLKRRGASVEILVLTSFDDEQKVFEALREGASGYLVKRVGPEKIRSAIDEIMAGGTVLEAQIGRRFWNLFESLRSARPVEATPSTDPWGLSEVEHEVLRLMAKGLSNPEIGRALLLERRTVRTHLGHLYRKMGVNSHVEAVVAAVRAGLVEP